MNNRNKVRTFGTTVACISIALIVTLIFYCLPGCGGGVDIGEADRVLTSFSLTWPEGFCFACLSNEPVTVTIKALDQNGEVFTSWSGSVDIELTNANIGVTPASVNLASGIVERSISFDNASAENEETGIKLSAEGVVTDMGVTLLVYTGIAVQPSGFSLAWPAGFDYTCASNEPLDVTINALDASGNVLGWSGTVNIVLMNTNVEVNPSTANLVNGTVQQSIAFSNATVQNQVTGIKLSYGDVVTELTETVLVYETDPPSDVTFFEALSWDGRIRLTWTNPLELDFAGVRVMRKENGPPANAGDGELVYEGNEEDHIDTGLANGTTYFYSAFAYDYAPNYSGGVTASGTPEGHAVGSVRYFPGNKKVRLIWDEEAGSDAYNIYYTDDGTEPGVQNYTGMVTDILGTESEVTELTNFTDYRFAVTAIRGGMESKESDVVRVIPPGNVITAGGYHTVALKDDGTVWAWGWNNHGQLGNDTDVPGMDSDTPVQVVMVLEGDPLTGVVAVAAGSYHAVALKESGTVWAWGWNNHGQLGDDTGIPGNDSDTPVQVVGEGGTGTTLTGVVAVAAGSYHAAALKESGTVWTWGFNYYGQLGVGTHGSETDRDTPVQVKGEEGIGTLTGVVAVTAGGSHTVALKADGTVWAWGRNDQGQLGVGTHGSETDRDTPVQVKGEEGIGTLTGVVAVAAGGNHTVALKADGTVWAWGDNFYGQLGDDNDVPGIDSDTPVQVVGEGGEGTLTGVVALAAGGSHTVALKADGTVWAWGKNDHGQLGDNTGVPGIDSDTPVRVKGEGGEGTLTGVVAVAAGSSYTVALKDDGTVWAWGNNEHGQLGDGNEGTDSDAPVQVTIVLGGDPLTGVVEAAAGRQHTVALKDDGTVWTWGSNGNGQLGDNTGVPGIDSDTPVQVVDEGGTGTLAGVAAVAAGYSHTVAVKTVGTVWAWGYNFDGQLGVGTHGLETDSDTPVQVVDAGDVTGFLTGVAAVAAGKWHTVALKEDGTVWAWGKNDQGQLGDGNKDTDSDTPVQVVDPGDGTGFLTGVSAMASGISHTVVLKEDGTVWAWGDNFYGQLGDGNKWTDSDMPVQVKGYGGSGTLEGVGKVAAGEDHTLAVKDNGSVWSWGRNNYGQLGNGNEGTDSATPVQVVGEGGTGTLTGVVAAAGRGHTIAVMGDGTVWAWGYNGEGQLGDDTGVPGTDSDTPVQVVGYGGEGTLTGVDAVAAGLHHTVAVKDDGKVWAWGWNFSGQLGNGNGGTDTDTPVLAGFLCIGWY